MNYNDATEKIKETEEMIQQLAHERSVDRREFDDDHQGKLWFQASRGVLRCSFHNYCDPAENYMTEEMAEIIEEALEELKPQIIAKSIELLSEQKKDIAKEIIEDARLVIACGEAKDETV